MYQIALPPDPGEEREGQEREKGGERRGRRGKEGVERGINFSPPTFQTKVTPLLMNYVGKQLNSVNHTKLY